MMFDIFLPYIGESDPKRVFFKIATNDLRAAEARLGYKFPNPLRRFFCEIGYGFWQQGVDDLADSYNTNRIIDPRSIARLILENDHETPLEVPLPAYQIPFFEVNTFSFLRISTHPANNGVILWNDGSEIAPSFEVFMKKLYHHATFWYEVEQ